MVIEITPEWTQDEDQIEKRGIYQDILGVQEYFLFDPLDDYLQPRLQGLRLAPGRYRPIQPVKGRLPSKVLGLHLEADGELLRLYDPAAKRWLLTPPETRQELLRLQQELKDIKADTERLRREREQLRLQTEVLRRQLPGSPGRRSRF
jgi:Uma2 family endonuclease